LVALEKANTEKEARGEFESQHPGYCGARDTFMSRLYFDFESNAKYLSFYLPESRQHVG
jgi:hypothetical protein